MQRSRCLAWINVVFCCALCHCTQPHDQKEAERFIVESERQWAESVASGDTGTIERILQMITWVKIQKGTFTTKRR